MEQSKGKGFLCTISTGSMANGFGIIVHGFGGSIIDGDIKPCEDAIFVSSDQPGKVFQRFEAAVSGPPEPLLEEPPRPASPLIGPELFEYLLQKICPVDLQVQPLQCAQADALFIGKVFGVLEPDVAGSPQEVGVGLLEGGSFCLADIIDGLQKVPHEMELIKDYGGIGQHFVDYINIGGPHITTYSLNTATAVLSQFFEESAECISIPTLCTPQKPFSAQVIDLGVIDMTTPPTDLVNPYVQDTIDIPVGKSISYGCLNSGSDGAPADPEQTGHYIPCQQPRPCGKHHNQRLGQRTLALSPRYGLDLDATVGTVYPGRLISNCHGDSPQWYMPPPSPSESVTHSGAMTALSTGKSTASYPVYMNHYLADAPLYTYDPVMLESKCLSYYTIHKYVFLLQGFENCKNPHKYLKGHVLFKS